MRQAVSMCMVYTDYMFMLMLLTSHRLPSTFSYHCDIFDGLISCIEMISKRVTLIYLGKYRSIVKSALCMLYSYEDTIIITSTDWIATWASQS